jgi:cell division protein FtsB
LKSTARRVAIAAAVVLSSVYVVMALRGPQGIPALQARWREIRALQQSNADLEKEVREMRSRISRLNGDPALLDVEIRQRLKKLKPGETSFILPEGSPGALPAQTVAHREVPAVASLETRAPAPAVPVSTPTAAPTVSPTPSTTPTPAFEPLTPDPNDPPQ